MTARYILKTTIFFCGVIQSAPAGKMSNGFCPCPVRIILVPGNHPSFFRRLPKKLVMPETNRTVTEQLTCCDEKSWVPQYIMESGADSDRKSTRLNSSHS